MTDADVSEHDRMLDELSAGFPNTITLMKSDHPINQYNCVKFALGLHEDDRCGWAEAKDPRNVLASTAFAQWLIETGTLREVGESSADASTEERICVYFDGSKLVHVGLTHANLVRSKWGGLGHLFQHGIAEVPESYGSEIRLFRGPVSQEEAFEWFKRWLRRIGWKVPA